MNRTHIYLSPANYTYTIRPKNESREDSEVVIREDRICTICPLYHYYHVRL